MKIIYNLAFLLLFTVSSSSLLPGSHPDPKTEKAGTAKIVFKSTDGGQNWQDISKGLPENFRVDSIRGNSFFTNDKGLFLRVENGLYHNKPNAASPFWTKEISPDEHSNIVPGKSGIFYWGVNLKTTNGTSVWSPMFENYLEPRLRSVFETAGGSIFICIDGGMYRSTDIGKTWKNVYAGGLLGNLAESNGVLLTVSMRRIIRSTDNGENWMPVISEDSVAWDVKPIKGGFAAITSRSESGTRRLSTSYDGGKTWQSIHSRLQDKVVIDSIGRTWNDRINDRLRAQTFGTSIVKVGENFFCTHPHGIFKSSDKGKTWELLLPSLDDKGFNLFVSGNVIYAIRSKGGC
ncbi:MAG: exo-alpha-sialidase [Bacteroidota bacterium]|nr:exo-alpha-sialidase [Bacteroidota bacterium]